MKKVLKILLILAIMIMPANILAAGNITASPSSLTIEVGSSKTFTITATNTIGDVSISSSNTNVATISSSEWETGMIEEGQTKTGTITVIGVSEGTATITLTLDAATFDGEDLSGQKRTINVTVRKISTNNNLSSLTIDKGTLSFDKNTTSYNVNVDGDIEKVTINATPESSKARVDGVGMKTLKYGDNKFEIKVTAENGNVKTYTVVVNRKDNRDTNNNLSSLTIDKGTLLFDKNTTSYNVNVDSDIEKVTINAVPENAKSKVEGAGEKILNIGSNKFEIKVTAENETVKTYTITVNRLEKDETIHVKDLTIDGVDISFDPDVLNYDITLSNQSELNFIYELEEGVTASLNGNENLKNGSIITLELVKDGKYNTYKFNVTKQEISSVIKEEPTKSKKWLIFVAIAIIFAVIGMIVKKDNKNKKEIKLDEVPDLNNYNETKTEIGDIETLTKDSQIINNNQQDNESIEKIDI